MAILSLYGLRNDGRKPDEIRKIRCDIGYMAHANGSVKYQIGNTEILVSVSGPHQTNLRQSGLQGDNAVINCKVESATFSSNIKPKKRGNTYQDIVQILKKSLESVILTHLLPKTQIDVFIEIVKNDGGLLCACLNAASLALMNASIPMTHQLVSCNVGVVKTDFCGILIDNDQEESEANLDGTMGKQNVEYLIDLNGNEDNNVSRASSNPNNNNLPGISLIARIKQFDSTSDKVPNGETNMQQTYNSPVTNDIQHINLEILAIEIQQRIPYELIEQSIMACEIACKRIYTLLNEYVKQDYINKYPENIC